MKKILATVIFLPILAFSYEINFNKSFSKVVNPDLLTTNINISVEKKDEKSVNIEIEKFNTFLKNTKNITIKNTNYNLTPKYDYENNKSIFKGFIANTRFQAESKEAKEINDFLDDLLALKDSFKSDDIKVNISNLSWDISENLQNKNIDELRIDVLLWIGNYTKELSNKIGKKCEVKNVNINEDFNYPTFKNRVMSSSLDMVNKSESINISPINTEEIIKINTNFVLDCK
ncbi:SIMPL domain-containing protein [Aliarcobacter cryaerophilus]|uniref:SIMPL domain-containing protein n=1 Tax=Aliarcobacter cryaerophilus TaxID=28198 RepID=A0A2S9TJ40_9BACT|nr:SIMPL domain-containing protein [Aliarcobacter cryaerophilus]PRM98878.1 SIMPL domain-containing protein [Arcobacter cryaerophilus gv. crypticus]